MIHTHIYKLKNVFLTTLKLLLFIKIRLELLTTNRNLTPRLFHKYSQLTKTGCRREEQQTLKMTCIVVNYIGCWTICSLHLHIKTGRNWFYCFFSTNLNSACPYLLHALVLYSYNRFARCHYRNIISLYTRINPNLFFLHSLAISINESPTWQW